MTNCGAPNCTNRSDADNGKDKTYHILPAESRGDLRKKWLAKIKRQKIPKNLYICSDHFEPECYEKDLRVSILIFILIVFWAMIRLPVA